MKGRLVLIVDRASARERNAITNAIKAAGRNSWWHWFQYAWLIVDQRNRPAKFWKDLVREAAPRVSALAVPVGELTPELRYAIRGNSKSFGWLKKNWTNEVGETPKPPTTDAEES